METGKRPAFIARSLTRKGSAAAAGDVKKQAWPSWQQRSNRIWRRRTTQLETHERRASEELLDETVRSFVYNVEAALVDPARWDQVARLVKLASWLHDLKHSTP